MFPPATSPTTGLQIYEHSYFGGAWTAQDRATVDKRGGLLAQNVRFFEKQVGTRYGWGTAFTVTEGSNSHSYYSMFNWLSELGNYLVWLDSYPNRGILVAKISDSPPTASLIYSTVSNNFGAVYATAGPRLFIALWTVDASGNVQPINPGACVSSASGTLNADTLIPGPASTTLIPATAPTEPGVGIVTAGLHNLGLRMQHRSGFLGRPGPDTSNGSPPTLRTFAPIQFTSAGLKNLQWAFTPGANWPTDVVSVQVVMSIVANPKRYFLVPGATQAVTGGAATAVSIVINIDDDTLNSEANEVTDSLNLFTDPSQD